MDALLDPSVEKSKLCDRTIFRKALETLTSAVSALKVGSDLRYQEVVPVGGPMVRHSGRHSRGGTGF